MEVIIRVAGAEKAQDSASLRAWLDAAGPGSPWTLATEGPASAEHLGPGVAEICAIIGAVEGLPPLISQIKGWFTTRKDPKPITLTITIDPRSGDVTISVPDRE